jgi:hypothetical protein
MRQLNSLNSYPVFPNWIFTGSLPLDNSQIGELVSDITKIENIKKPYGFHTKFNSVTPNIYNLSRLVGQTFYDNAVAHYRLPKHMRNIESVDPTMYCIAPGHSVPVMVNRHRWYQAAVFLSPNSQGSDIYLETFDGKLYSTPPEVQEYTHTIDSQQCKMVFWPAHIPWGITTNKGLQNSVIFSTTFIIKRG